VFFSPTEVDLTTQWSQWNPATVFQRKVHSGPGWMILFVFTYNDSTHFFQTNFFYSWPKWLDSWLMPSPPNLPQLQIGHFIRHWSFILLFFVVTFSFPRTSCHFPCLPHNHLISHFFFFEILELELRAFTLSHSTSPSFCDRVFQDRVLYEVFAWAGFELWSSDSSVVRIIGMSHQCPPHFSHLIHITVESFRK
jgi:hypothetical protein